VIDTASRKVVGKATFELTPDEQAVRSRSHGIGIANGGKEVWVNDVVHNLTFVFDVTTDQPKQIARFAVGKQPYWNVPSKDGQTMYVACPSSDEVIAFDVATKKEKTRFSIPGHPTRMLVVAAPRDTTSTARLQ
jgi:DNA-binding beta-propeller fold protein YncE